MEKHKQKEKNQQIGKFSKYKQKSKHFELLTVHSQHQNQMMIQWATTKKKQHIYNRNE